jgi:hypothetical protein
MVKVVNAVSGLAVTVRIAVVDLTLLVDTLFVRQKSNLQYKISMLTLS